MTKAQLTNIIAGRLQRKHYKTLAWSDVVAAVQGASATPKQEIVEALSNRQPGKVGFILQGLIDQRVKTLADNEATTMLTDDVLTLTELEQVLS